MNRNCYGNCICGLVCCMLVSLSSSRGTRLHTVHGNRWTTIGKALGMSGRAAQDKFRSMTKREKKGEGEIQLVLRCVGLSQDITN